MAHIALEFPTFPFEYEIFRTRRKTLVIYVKSGKVEVRSPLRASSTWIHSFLKEKTAWILDQLATQKLKQKERLVIGDNRLVPFLGRPRRILVVLSNQQKAQLKGDHLYLYSRDNHPVRLEKLFNTWLQDQAREFMATETIKMARMLGVERKLKDVAFRKTRSKWGHCCQDGTIQYNWLAMMAPREVVRYLIIHESCHLRYLNHSARFWDLVESICPDYKVLRNWLADNGHRFWTRLPAH
jgi:hypothetical protein